MRCYSSISALPEQADLAVIAIEALKVPDMVRQCAKAGVRAAVIISSGFSEVGTGQGKKLQEELVEICQTTGIRVLGPNNLGSYNVYDKIVASTSTALFYYDELKPGGIAWITQSGALGSTIQARAADEGIGLSYVVTSGNSCDLNEADFIWYMADDPRVKVIGIYAEEIHDWKSFGLAVEKAEKKGIPVLVYKAGISERGAAAAKAHTGSEAGDPESCRRYLRECRAVQVETLDELYQTAYLLEQWKDFKKIERYGIVTISGGEGGILADGLTKKGLAVPCLSEKTLEQVAELIPAFGSPQNPVDVTAHMMRTPERLGQVTEVLEHAEETDALIYSLTTVAREWEFKIAESIVSQIHKKNKPGVVCWYSSRINEKAVAYLRAQGIVVFTDNGALIRALGRKKQIQDMEETKWKQSDRKQ